MWFQSAVQSPEGSLMCLAAVSDWLSLSSTAGTPPRVLGFGPHGSWALRGRSREQVFCRADEEAATLDPTCVTSSVTAAHFIF